MAGPLPSGWTNKRVLMMLNIPNARRFQATLTDDNETGVAVEMGSGSRSAGPIRRFYPWTIIRMIELTEEPDETELR